MTTEVQQFIIDYMPDFAKIYMLPQYRESSTTLALARCGDVFVWKAQFDAASIPMEHAAMIYALTFVYPYREEVGYTANGVVTPNAWIVSHYNTYKAVLNSYSNGTGPVDPDPDPGNEEEPNDPPIDIGFFATQSGAQEILLPGTPRYFDLYINGLRQDRDNCTLSGLTLQIGAAYQIMQGDNVLVSHFP